MSEKRRSIFSFVDRSGGPTLPRGVHPYLLRERALSSPCPVPRNISFRPGTRSLPLPQATLHPIFPLDGIHGDLSFSIFFRRGMQVLFSRFPPDHRQGFRGIGGMVFFSTMIAPELPPLFPDRHVARPLSGKLEHSFFSGRKRSYCAPSFSLPVRRMMTLFFFLRSNTGFFLKLRIFERWQIFARP